MTYIWLLPIFIILIIFIKRPSNDRNWRENHKILSSAKFEGDYVSVQNIRHSSYANRHEYTTEYYDKKFNLKDLVSASMMIIDTEIPIMTHSFISFEFKNKEYLSISVEVRHVEGPDFPFLKIFLRQRELLYVVADERDVIQLRTNYKNDPFYMYPLNLLENEIRGLFVDMLKRANKLSEEPELWNPINNTCVTNLADHINNVSPKRIPFNLKLILTDNIDKFFYKIGLIDNTLPFMETRKKYHLNKRAKEHADDPDFSNKIRTN